MAIGDFRRRCAIRIDDDELRIALASRFRDPLLIFVGGYFVAGVIQFTGVDAIVWLIYGLQWGVTRGGAGA